MLLALVLSWPTTVVMDCDEDDDIGDANGNSADGHGDSEGESDHPVADYCDKEDEDAKAGDDEDGPHVNQMMMKMVPTIMTIVPVVNETDPLVLHMTQKMHRHQHQHC